MLGGRPARARRLTRGACACALSRQNPGSMRRASRRRVGRGSSRRPPRDGERAFATPETPCRAGTSDRPGGSSTTRPKGGRDGPKTALREGGSRRRAEARKRLRGRPRGPCAHGSKPPSQGARNHPSRAAGRLSRPTRAAGLVGSETAFRETLSTTKPSSEKPAARSPTTLESAVRVAGGEPHTSRESPHLRVGLRPRFAGRSRAQAVANMAALGSKTWPPVGNSRPSLGRETDGR
jgi:hypothetical protein